MHLKCNCGRNTTVQPYKLATVHVWICDQCRAKNRRKLREQSPVVCTSYREVRFGRRVLKLYYK